MKRLKRWAWTISVMMTLGVCSSQAWAQDAKDCEVCVSREVAETCVAQDAAWNEMVWSAERDAEARDVAEANQRRLERRIEDLVAQHARESEEAVTSERRRRVKHVVIAVLLSSAVGAGAGALLLK